MSKELIANLKNSGGEAWEFMHSARVVWEGYGLEAVSRIEAQEARIQELERALEIAERNRDAARSNFLTLQSSMASLVQKIESEGQIVAKLVSALEIISGRKPALDNLMGNREIAIAALSHINTNEAEK